MSGENPAAAKGIPSGQKAKAGTTMGRAKDCAQHEAGGEVRNFLPQNGNVDVPAIFENGLRNTFEPLFDETAAALHYNDTYLKVKAQPFWLELLTKTCLAFYRVNHDVIPDTEAQLREAQTEIYVEVVKRSGRDYYPDFNQRNRHLREIGMGSLATKAREAAKTFAKRDGDPALSSHFLKEILAILWLPASLWMLDDQRIAASLPLLLNKEGKTFLTDWIEGIETGSISRQAVARLGRTFELPRAREMFGNYCGSFNDTPPLRGDLTAPQLGHLTVNWSVCGSWRKRRNRDKK